MKLFLLQKIDKNKSFLKKQPPEGFCKKGILKNSTKFTRKHLCWSLFFNKVSDLRPTTLLKKRLRHRCFQEFYESFDNTFFIEYLSAITSFPNLSHSFISQRGFIYLFKLSFVRKIVKTHNFANTFYTLCCECIL